MELDNPSLTIALAMVCGVIAQGISRHTRLPGIVLLLAIGVVLGPDVADLIRPASMGAALPGLVGFAVAVILFEGGLNLNLKHLRSQAKPIRRLVTIGALVTAIGAAVVARLVMGWEWRLSILFGTLVIVTGPTVITPLLRLIKVRHNLEIILEAEGIFIDAIGATIAVVALEVVLAAPGETLHAIGSIASRIGLGTGIGFSGGVILAILLRYRKIVPQGLHNILTLAFALAIFQISDSMVAESGIIAVIVAGMVVGNVRTHVLQELKEFQDQLTVLLVATLFVLLAADVRIDDVLALGVPGLVTVVLIMVVVRPANVFASTYGTDLTGKEKAFLSWLAPRGIVAAAVASLFAQHLLAANIEGGVEMRALVFLVIAVTVVAQGLSGGLVARVLGVRRARNEGYLLLGAHALGRRFGAVIQGAGERVIFIDANQECCKLAEDSGFEVVCGNGLEEQTWLLAQAESRAACIGITPSEETNFLFACKIRERFREATTFVALETATSGVTEEMVNDLGVNVLFGTECDLEIWEHRFRRDQVTLQRWRYSVPEAGGDMDVKAIPHQQLLPMAAFRKGRLILVDQGFEARRGDVIEFALFDREAGEAKHWLQLNGWGRVGDAAAEAG